MRSGGSRARVATLEPTTTDSCSQESAKNEEKITGSITAWHGWHRGCFPVPNREASVVASGTYTGQEAVTSFRENTYTHMVWVEEGGHCPCCQQPMLLSVCDTPGGGKGEREGVAPRGRL